MTLGALIDAGVPEEVIRDALDRVGIGGYRLKVRQVLKRGIRATDVTVDVTVDVTIGATGEVTGDDDKSDHDHHHNHDHADDHDHDHADGHEHHHRRYRDIRDMIVQADLSADIAQRALSIFERLAQAEAFIHDSTLDEVAFHEVGAIDSIVDIVGTAAALAWLAPARVTAAGVAVGHGSATCAHGILPVPVPATLEILRRAKGVMVRSGLARELCTPTGAAILAASVDDWAPMPNMCPTAIGYGSGDADLPDRANVLRVTLGRPSRVYPGRKRTASSDNAAQGHDELAAESAADSSAADESAVDGAVAVWRMEANIDDMNPELCAHAADMMLESGALDVWWTPITMKKGRPALLLGALVPISVLDDVTDVLLRETTSLGVRFDPVSRRTLTRDWVDVDTPYGTLPIKRGLAGDTVVNIAPEHEPCRQAAKSHGVALKRVYEAARLAYGR